jgi:hypothetical protein
MSTFAKGTTNPDDAGAFSEDDFANWMRIAEQWGEGRSLAYFMPSRDEGRLYRQLYATFERAALSRGMARAAVASTLEIDVTAALQCIRVPTLVMHCTDDFMPVSSGKYGFQFGTGRQYRLKGIDQSAGAAELTPSDQHPLINRWRPNDAGRGSGQHAADRLLVAGARRFSRVAHVASRYQQRS